MENDKIKTPKKGAIQRLRELHKKNHGKASPELLDILKVPTDRRAKKQTVC